MIARGSTALLVLAGAAGAQEALSTPRAEAELACAAVVAHRQETGRPAEGVGPAAMAGFLAAAVAGEAAATGAFTEDLMPRVRARFDLLKSAFDEAAVLGEASIDGLLLRGEDIDALAALCARRTGSAP